MGGVGAGGVAPGDADKLGTLSTGVTLDGNGGFSLWTPNQSIAQNPGGFSLSQPGQSIEFTKDGSGSVQQSPPKPWPPAA